jgi:Domain of unknown function (DUF4105)
MKGNFSQNEKKVINLIGMRLVRFSSDLQKIRAVPRFVWAYVFMYFAIFTTMAQPVSLSGQSRISLITCGPGEVLYEAFGHSAIRITDPSQHLDLVFNYGMFDFNQDNFYGNFAKGSMRYMLGMSGTADFIHQYRFFNRSVREQVLNLDSAEKLAIAVYLNNNLLPENREYFYDYFDNNCSTKIIELLDSALHRKVVWKFAQPQGTLTYRSMIYDYTTYQDWGRFGIDLGLGAVIDRPLKGMDLNFLPDELERSVSRASIRRGMMDFPLVSSSEVLFESAVSYGAGSFFFSPSFLFSLVLFLALFLWFRSSQSAIGFRILRSLLFTTSGLLGIVELSIWLFTNHKSAAWNYNILWANPLFFAIGLLIWFYEKPLLGFLTGFRYYLIGILIFWFLIPQQLNTNLIPLVAALVVVCVPRVTNQKKESFSGVTKA